MKRMGNHQWPLPLDALSDCGRLSEKWPIRIRTSRLFVALTFQKTDCCRPVDDKLPFTSKFLEKDMSVR